MSPDGGSPAMGRDGLTAVVEPHVGRLLDDAVASGAHDGGPFSAMAIDVRTGGCVASATNRVTSTLDPTAHAEICALRAAAAATGRVNLNGIVLLASCEPCPMCLAACLWSRIDAVVFLASRRDAADAGFDDEAFHAALGAPDRLPAVIAGMTVLQLAHPRSREPFDAWLANEHRIAY